MTAHDAHAQPARQGTPAAEFTCPMHPEVRRSGPSACPTCGMALEPAGIPAPARTEWTCPMHPEIVRDAPGTCPICGMALEPRTATAERTEDAELADMTRRLWVSAALTAPLLVVAMGPHLTGASLRHVASPRALAWLELLLASPVVLWGGWPFFERGWRSIGHRPRAPSQSRGAAQHPAEPLLRVRVQRAWRSGRRRRAVSGLRNPAEPGHRRGGDELQLRVGHRQRHAAEARAALRPDGDTIPAGAGPWLPGGIGWKTSCRACVRPRSRAARASGGQRRATAVR